ncbi:hypothetical protein [Exiguobacterium sp. MH3]|uniref:hypothetical protein n=1 Tax=Exiguobacterium sp. MH3 TaxID=1399115 RepID=UPI0003C3B310|nr:hypothetical protein [Exiguobacterium sp. MH3]AHA31326.1 hypothetical protein U719_06810 [Exiguobacterium sp. MH3]
MKILLLGENQLAITGEVSEINRVIETLTVGSQVDLLLKTACMKKINVVLPNKKEATTNEQVTFVFD